jgi:predicted AlkP superfamily phosphohydrolase/phosphomutase
MDGLEPRLVRDLLAQRRLPTFRRLIARGTLAGIDVREDPVKPLAQVSPAAWTTIATGCRPEDHGITDFLRDGALVNSTMRRRPAVWNILTRAGLEVATIGWFVTWPAESDGGIVVSDRTHGPPQEGKVYPPGVIDPSAYEARLEPLHSSLARFTDYPYDAGYKHLAATDPRFEASFLMEERLAMIHARDESYARAAQAVAAGHDLDALLVYFQGSDTVGHGFWKYFEPEPFRQAGWTVDPTLVAHLGPVIPRYYDYLDEKLAALLALADPEALVVVLSDHGHGPGLGEYETKMGTFMSGNHRLTGVLLLAGPDVKVGAQPSRAARLEDILPTLLYATRLPLARDMPGRPLAELFGESFRASRRVAYVETYRTPPKGAPRAIPGPDDAALIENLRSLGYVR